MSNAAPYTFDSGRIRLGNRVLVYLERTLAPKGPLKREQPPRAYGLTPMSATADGTIAAAVAEDEAMWLGFQPVASKSRAIVRVRVSVGDTQSIDAVSGGTWRDEMSDDPRNYLTVPPAAWLIGVKTADGYVPFQAPQLLNIVCSGYTADVELVSPATFTALSGRTPEPIDPDSGYQGWRLP